VITPQARAEILTRWHAGVTKRDIAIVLRIPIDQVGAVVAEDLQATQQRARKTPTEAKPIPVDELIAEAEQSTRQRTRSLAARTRAAIDELTSAVRVERQRVALDERVKELSAELAAARKALRETTF
jgi:hypothetical protein